MAKNKHMDANENNSSISKSKAKRDERKKEVAKAKNQKLRSKIIGIIVAVLIVAVVAIAAGKEIYLAAIRTTSDSNLSAGLTADGKIDGVDVTSAVNLVDFENIQVPAEEVAATAEEVEAEITSVLDSNKELSEDATLEIADGDTVNIDYVGTIDGVEFEGGNSNGAGYDLTIGSGSFVDDFEQQLIGHKPGEEVTVEVTFPEDYSGADVAGKDASFAVTIHGIMVTPELTDEFVSANFAETDGVSTVAEYRAMLENNFYEEHLKEYLTNYIVENSTINAYPNKYVDAMKAVTKYDDEYMMQYYNQMFSSYGMESYSNVWDTRGEEIKDELSYEKELTERAKDTVKTAIVYQAIYEKAGLSIDMDATIAEMTEENGEEYVTNMKETYGEGYMAQAEMKETVIEYLMDKYKTN